MQELSGVAREIAAGRIQQTVALESKDEIGQLADAFRGMIQYVGGIAHAEYVFLKNGKIFQGKIIQESDDSLTIGILEPQALDGKPRRSAVAARH
jgi:hypothetical protein